MTARGAAHCSAERGDKANAAAAPGHRRALETQGDSVATTPRGPVLVTPRLREAGRDEAQPGQDEPIARPAQPTSVAGKFACLL